VHCLSVETTKIKIPITPTTPHTHQPTPTPQNTYIGKSFLLNQVARSLPSAAANATRGEGEGEQEQGAKEVFKIGEGVDPETSGRWVGGWVICSALFCALFFVLRGCWSTDWLTDRPTD
jgi:hypothetical protein